MERCFLLSILIKNQMTKGMKNELQCFTIIHLFGNYRLRQVKKKLKEACTYICKTVSEYFGKKLNISGTSK